ncbi:MAG: ABC transporter ATP-binding protein [Rhodomicrobium sp.]
MSAFNYALDREPREPGAAQLDLFETDAASSGAASDGLAPANGNLKPGIVVESLSKAYGGKLAVDNVSFMVSRGGTVGLLGGNGAGKTTTIAMMLGLVTPSSGRALVLGCDMAKTPHAMLPRMNFESPYVSLPAKLTVRQNLNVFGKLYGVASLKDRIEALAEEYDLGDVLDRLTGSLSAGQKTRVAIAKALLNEPDVLLLDEPTASLDPGRADWVRESLEAYRAKRGATILLSSHNMAEVERLCDFVVVMSHGRVAEMGEPWELTERYRCADLYEVFIEIARGEGR